MGNVLHQRKNKYIHKIMVCAHVNGFMVVVSFDWWKNKLEFESKDFAVNEVFLHAYSLLNALQLLRASWLVTGC